MDREHLLERIERFAAAKGIAPATVTSRAVGNSRLYQRLCDGGDCTTGTVRRLIEFMAHEGPPSTDAPASVAGE